MKRWLLFILTFLFAIAMIFCFMLVMGEMFEWMGW